MNAVLFFLVINSFLLFFLSLIVFVGNFKKLENIFFSLMGFFVAIWSFAIFEFLFNKNLTIKQEYLIIFYLSPIVISLSAMFFSQYFLNITRLSKKINTSLLLIGIFIIASFLYNRSIFIKSFQYYGGLKYVVSFYAISYILYGLYLIINFSILVLLIFKKFKNTNSLISKQQIKLFLFSACLAIIGGLLFNYFLPLFNDYNFIYLGPLFGLIYFFINAYSIIYHRQFDIRFYLFRTFGYVLALLFSLVILSIPVVFFIKQFLGLRLDFLQLLFVLTLIVLVTIVSPILIKVVSRITNKYFYRYYYDPQTLINNINSKIVNTRSISSLIDSLSAIFVNDLKIDFIEFYLLNFINNNNRILDKKDIAVIFKNLKKQKTNLINLETDNEFSSEISDLKFFKKVSIILIIKDHTNKTNILGFIILGNKLNGGNYSVNDIKVLESFVSIYTVSIQNLLYFNEIQFLNQNLEKRILDATLKLRQSNDKLKQLDASKDDFISMASHQLRTPLTSVKGYLSMLLEGDAGPINESQKTMLNQAFFSAQKMVYLIADLLNVSRIKTGKFLIENKPSNLANVVEEEVNQLVQSAENNHLSLSFNKPDNFPNLMLDETKIRQVIMNFIDNAIYYTPSGGKINVSLVEKNQTVEFKVKDNGIGVSKKDQHRLFSKFYRADNARAVRPDGTGLGLYMAKKVIIGENGSLIFESNEGKGSTFGFILSKDKLIIK